MAKAGTNAVETGKQSLLADDLIFEFMLNALRLKQGFASSLMQERTGIDRDKFEPFIKKAAKDGLLQCENGLIIPSESGYRYLNNLVSYFIVK